MMNRNILLFLATFAAVSARAVTFYSDGSVLSLAERNGAVEYMRGAFLPCYSRSHRHPPIPGAWQTDGSRETRAVPPCETIELAVK